ncbi:hypothetical protein PROFUN_00830 [Planoprotostelium fungivorum]|uniref:Uncharacterized protein n=1 Tax=Planoprotostelium fungivorum TaxID=1890364 RepID=A0A2P6P031_9EUKA|nr:hypothetical protein PROFUN_00830 [Planoprotostelium fungivorum]
MVGLDSEFHLKCQADLHWHRGLSLSSLQANNRHSMGDHSNDEELPQGYNWEDNIADAIDALREQYRRLAVIKNATANRVEPQWNQYWEEKVREIELWTDGLHLEGERLLLQHRTTSSAHATSGRPILCRPQPQYMDGLNSDTLPPGYNWTDNIADAIDALHERYRSLVAIKEATSNPLDLQWNQYWERKVREIEAWTDRIHLEEEQLLSAHSQSQG